MFCGHLRCINDHVNEDVMSYKTIALIAAVAVGGMGTANGQFLEKLGKKAEKAAERTVERRVEREAEKKTDKALDKVFEAGEEKGKKEKGAANENATAGGKGNVDENDAAVARRQSALAAMLGGGSMEEVRDTYAFSYRATMEITDDSEKEETTIWFWLEPEATYFGTEVQAGETRGQIAVMDMDIKSMVMFMDDGKQKMAMRMGGNQQLMDKYIKMAGDDGKDDLNISAIESKTILGYHCKGFKIETDEGISKVWVTEEAPVGMANGMMKGDYLSNGLPNIGANALLMETEYAPKEGDKNRFRMVCTALEPTSKAIHKKDYKSAI